MDIHTLQIVQPSLAASEPHWTVIMTAFLPPAIALMAVVVAISQWRIARMKLKLDLYEKRMVVYEAVKSALCELVIHGKTDPDIERDYLKGIAGSKWLFNKRLADYLNNELWGLISKLACSQSMADSAPPGEERSKEIKSQWAITSELNKQLTELDKRFYPFLSLSH